MSVGLWRCVWLHWLTLLMGTTHRVILLQNLLVCCTLHNHEKIEISTSGPFYMELVSVAQRQMPATCNLNYFIDFYDKDTNKFYKLFLSMAKAVIWTVSFIRTIFSKWHFSFLSSLPLHATNLTSLFEISSYYVKYTNCTPISRVTFCSSSVGLTVVGPKVLLDLLRRVLFILCCFRVKDQLEKSVVACCYMSDCNISGKETLVEILNGLSQLLDSRSLEWATLYCAKTKHLWQRLARLNKFGSWCRAT